MGNIERIGTTGTEETTTKLEYHLFSKVSILSTISVVPVVPAVS